MGRAGKMLQGHNEGQHEDISYTDGYRGWLEGNAHIVERTHIVAILLGLE